MQSCGKNSPRAERQGTKKEVCFAHRTFFSWFYMMPPSMSPLQSKFEVFYVFQQILQGP
jgi:hypothetical protein